MFVARAKACLTTCQGKLEELKARLEMLHMKNPNGFRQKIQAGGLRALYPFRKSTLAELKAIVQSLMHQLGHAVQLIIMDSSDSTRSIALQIKEEADNISSLSTQIKDSISSLSTQIDALTISTHTQAVDTAASVQMLISSGAMTAANVQTLLSTEDATKLKDILIWLNAPDRSIEHEGARRKHQKGTGEWLLQGKTYQDWVAGFSPLLWLHGKAGCCKTVLSSTVIQDLNRRIANQPGTSLAFFYFAFSDAMKQSYKDLLLSMVTELSRGRPIIASLLELYKARAPYKPSIEGLEETLIATIKESTVSYLVADALDECSEEQRYEVMQGFKCITHACPSTRILITSRKESDIEDLVQDWCGAQLAVDENCVNADIDIFVKDALATDRKLMRLSDSTKSDIQRVFHEKSDGMFRWAALQLDSIRSLKILRPTYISAALNEMPRTLDETYDRVLSAIDDKYSDEAKIALYWLAFSARPITVAELAEACSIRIVHKDEPSLEEGGYDAVTGLLDVISSFVLLGEPVTPREVAQRTDSWPQKFEEVSSRPVRLAHFSVKEYLISTRLRDRETRFSKYWLDKSYADRTLS